jgi:ribosome assembly protein 4
MEGNAAGPQLSIPLDTDPKKLTQLINELLQNKDRVPYAFYVDETELVADLKALLQEKNISAEKTLTIQYQPLSVFRVRPVTRCSDTMPGHSGAILHCSFSPDGEHLVSGGGDNVVRFWDTKTCTPRFSCKGHKDHVLCTAWSPTAQWFATADRSGEIRVWDPKSGKCVKVWKRHTKWVTALSWEVSPLSNAICWIFFSRFLEVVVCVRGSSDEHLGICLTWPEVVGRRRREKEFFFLPVPGAGA